MALGIHLTNVTPLFPTKVFLQWDLDDPTESGSYTFTIQRSGSTEGPWESLLAGGQNIYNYIDDFSDQPTLPEDGKANLFSLQREVYYRVIVVPPSGCANQAVAVPRTFEEVNLPPVQAGLRRRLRYDEQVLFSKFNGVRLALLKRRRWGTRCTSCYDSLTRAVTREQCTECYATGFVGGYWAPVLVYGRVHPPHNVDAQTTPRDKNEAAQQHITLLDIPRMADGDLVVEISSNKRHVVRRQTQTEIRRQAVHQQLTTSLIERGAIEYQIAVDPKTIPPLL